MIWGEPNRTPNFKPSTPATSNTGKLKGAQQVSPRNYAILLDAAYAAIKAEGPADKVIGGNTYTAAGKDDINTYQWAKYMKLPNGSRPRMDMWGHNPWGFTLPNFDDPPGRRGTVTFSDLKRLTKVLDKEFKPRKLKLFLAEWGVPSGFKDKDLGYTLKLKEANLWINTAFKLMRKFKRIYSLGWVHLVDNPQELDRPPEPGPDAEEDLPHVQEGEGLRTEAPLGAGTRGARLGVLTALGLTLALAAGVSAGAVGGATQPGAETAAPAPQTVKKSVWGPTSLNGESLWPTYRDLGVGLLLDPGALGPDRSHRARRADGSARSRLRVAGVPGLRRVRGNRTRNEGPDPDHGRAAVVKRRQGMEVVPAGPAGLRRLRHRHQRQVPQRRSLDDLGRAQPQAELRALHPGDEPDREAEQGPAGRPTHLRQAARPVLPRAQGRRPVEPGDRRQHLHRLRARRATSTPTSGSAT